MEKDIDILSFPEANEWILSHISDDQKTQLTAAYIAASKVMGDYLFTQTKIEIDREQFDRLLVGSALEEINTHLDDLRQPPFIVNFFCLGNDGDRGRELSLAPKSCAPDDLADELLKGYRSLISERPATIREALRLAV